MRQKHMLKLVWIAFCDYFMNRKELLYRIKLVKRLSIDYSCRLDNEIYHKYHQPCCAMIWIYSDDWQGFQCLQGFVSIMYHFPHLIRWPSFCVHWHIVHWLHKKFIRLRLSLWMRFCICIRSYYCMVASRHSQVLEVL